MNVDTSAVSILQRIALYLFLISLSHSPMLVYRPSFFLSVSTSFFNVCLSSVLICLPVCLFLSHSALFLCFSSTSPRLFYFPPLSYSFCLSAPPSCLSVFLSASPPPSRGRWCVGGCLWARVAGAAASPLSEIQSLPPPPPRMITPPSRCLLFLFVFLIPLRLEYVSAIPNPADPDSVRRFISFFVSSYVPLKNVSYLHYYHQ